MDNEDYEDDFYGGTEKMRKSGKKSKSHRVSRGLPVEIIVVEDKKSKRPEHKEQRNYEEEIGKVIKRQDEAWAKLEENEKSEMRDSYLKWVKGVLNGESLFIEEDFEVDPENTSKFTKLVHKPSLIYAFSKVPKGEDNALSSARSDLVTRITTHIDDWNNASSDFREKYLSRIDLPEKIPVP